MTRMISSRAKAPGAVKNQLDQNREEKSNFDDDDDDGGNRLDYSAMHSPISVFDVGHT